MQVLVTGATGKVGAHFLHRFLADPKWRDWDVRALCHHRLIEETDRLSVVQGTISDRPTVIRAMQGITHVVHMATCKETPEDAMDVAVKGMFWLLEEARVSPSFRQFILIGGDCTVGHFFVEHDAPVTEETARTPYPGCYALSKVLEEVMLEQTYIQYDLNGCCLRAPWIMEKDDFRYSLSFGDDVFGGPVWKDLVAPEEARRHHQQGTVPLLRDASGAPLKRNFVHVDDLVAAILCALDNPQAHQQLFNISMDAPVDYAALAAYLQRSRGLDSIDIASDFHSNWLVNEKAKKRLGWQPAYDLEKLVESAWAYQRAEDSPRKVWYPG
ncbi:MAG: NAD(P)-dependent oxidoreductase [Rhodospirillales bacterium]|nr:NAD(P)-dependent oxidoreductase [Rhodospirillales bacterium]